MDNSWYLIGVNYLTPQQRVDVILFIWPINFLMAVADAKILSVQDHFDLN